MEMGHRRWVRELISIDLKLIWYKVRLVGKGILQFDIPLRSNTGLGSVMKSVMVHHLCSMSLAFVCSVLLSCLFYVPSPHERC